MIWRSESKCTLFGHFCLVAFIAEKIPHKVFHKDIHVEKVCNWLHLLNHDALLSRFFSLQVWVFPSLNFKCNSHRVKYINIICKLMIFIFVYIQVTTNQIKIQNTYLSSTPADSPGLLPSQYTYLKDNHYSDLCPHWSVCWLQINGTMNSSRSRRCVFFWIWLPSPQHYRVRGKHSHGAYRRIWSILVPQCLTVWLQHKLRITSAAHGRLSCFHFLTISNRAAMNIVVHVFWCAWTLISL